MQTSFIKYCLLHIFCPLSLGWLLYFLFSKARIPLFNFSCLQTIQNQIPDISIPSFFIYQLPDGLWSYAFCATLCWIWRDRKAALVGFFAFLICSFYECLQLSGLFAGTFDIWDLVIMFIGCWAAAKFTKNRSC